MHGDPLSNDLFARLIAAAMAYPRDLFPPLSEEVRARFPDLIAAASAEMGRSLGPLLAEAAVAVLRASDGARLTEDGRKGLEQLDRWAGASQSGALAGVPKVAPTVTIREEDGPVVAYPLSSTPLARQDGKQGLLDETTPAQWLLSIVDLASDAKHAVKAGKLDLAADQLIAAASELARWHASLARFEPAARPNVNFPRYR